MLLEMKSSVFMLRKGQVFIGFDDALISTLQELLGLSRSLTKVNYRYVYVKKGFAPAYTFLKCMSSFEDLDFCNKECAKDLPVRIIMQS